jgi:hypothetical protein
MSIFKFDSLNINKYVRQVPKTFKKMGWNRRVAFGPDPRC